MNKLSIIIIIIIIIIIKKELTLISNWKSFEAFRIWFGDKISRRVLKTVFNIVGSEVNFPIFTDKFPIQLIAILWISGKVFEDARGRSKL